jgi:amidase
MRVRTVLLLLAGLLGAFYSVWALCSCWTSTALSLPFQIDLLTATVADILQLLENGTVTSEQLINEYIQRIDENNYRGLNLRAVLEVAPYESLIKQAQLYDLERENGHIRGPLHGVPVLVKDNIATDSSLGMNTTAGSYALRLSLII